MHLTLFRDRSDVLSSRVPQIGNLTCERILGREPVGTSSNIGWAKATTTVVLTQQKDQGFAPLGPVWARSCPSINRALSLKGRWSQALARA
jgi:hypothetical protein